MINNKRLKKVLIIVSGLFFTSCSLNIPETDSFIVQSETGGAFTGVDPTTQLSTGYANLDIFKDQANLYALAEVSSDELLVPTRGTDWGDNGVWRTLHTHSWDATHAHVVNVWNGLNERVFRMNQLLAPESSASAAQTAEGKFLRALYMFHILDFWGKVPFRGVNDGGDVNPQVMEAQAAFDFIVQDLEDALSGLPSTGPSTDNTLKASKASANFLLAKLFLNKHIYLGTSADSADMTKVVQYCDAIKADGFDIESGYFDIFKEDQDTETLFWRNFSIDNRIWNGLHYHHNFYPDNAGGGWNGFSTLSDFYNLFEDKRSNPTAEEMNTNPPGSGEERRGFVPTSYLGYGFLLGQQYDDKGNKLKDRSGNNLIFTRQFNPTGGEDNLVGNDENTGIRVIKYHPENGSFKAHYIFYRYADVHLMKAEAIMRGGTASGGETALGLINELRMKRDATPLSALTEADMLAERGRELYAEGWRRNDQVRFGTFDDAWSMKTSTESHRVRYPIPAVALSSNPNLTQNPGY